MTETSIFAEKFDLTAHRLHVSARANAFTAKTFPTVIRLAGSLQSDRSRVYKARTSPPTRDSNSWRVSFYAYALPKVVHVGRPYSQLEMLRCDASMTLVKQRRSIRYKGSNIIAGWRSLPILYREDHIRERVGQRLIGEETPEIKFRKLGHDEIAGYGLMYLEMANTGSLFNKYPTTVLVPLPTGVGIGEIREGSIARDMGFSVFGTSGREQASSPTPQLPHHIVIRTYVDYDRLKQDQIQIYDELQRIRNDDETGRILGQLMLYQYLGTMTDYSGITDPAAYIKELNLSDKAANGASSVLDMGYKAKNIGRLCALAEDLVPLLEEIDARRDRKQQIGFRQKTGNIVNLHMK